ncbi:mechanosensitive ion channel family protein [Pseudomonas aeruginosa]|nr:mechanosensitive ion channel family protein [Pseudomonas aeruginosa]MCO2795008.1 mechanosensitive ion channel family protein [Pseudomonas aeruginosa]MCO3206404.1 mechanosensitive ion channel family protein [Pseudomonas aeruginosa]MDV6765432.1 mechanosensitive ion channel family protein [Pseudomonas aeruginosa]MDV6828258.1 mechanosensitive ion channel family protein [Pseudomonas aeruginosa]
MRRASLHMLLCQFAMALGLLLSLGSEAWAARPAPQAAVDLEAPPALAEDASLDQLNAQLDLIRQRVTADASDDLLAELRQSALQVQRQADALLALRVADIERLDDQLKVIGPPQPDEAESLAAQRQALTRQKNALLDDERQATQLGQSSRDLAAQIVNLRRSLFNSQISSRAATPFSPSFWSTLIRPTDDDLRRLDKLKAEALVAFDSAIAPGHRWAFAGTLLATVLVWSFGRRLLERMLTWAMIRWLPEGRLRRSALALAVGLATILTIVGAVSLMRWGLESNASLSPDMASLTDQLVSLATFCAFIAGLGRALLMLPRPSWRLPAIPDRIASALGPFPAILAVALMLVATEERINSVTGTSLALTVALNGLTALVTALLLAFLPVGSSPSELLQGFAQLGESSKTLGNLNIVPQDILVALLLFVGGLFALRIVKRWLSERLLPETNMDAGMRASLVTLVGYLGFVLLAMLVMSTLRINLTSLTWVVSALSVGIGFGLQAIVQNFISGLILLTERPVKVGDWVSLGGVEGDIRRINVRATEIQMGDRSTVIVPNSQFISQTVRNVTMGNALGVVGVNLTLPLDTDAMKVRELLLQAFAEHPAILDAPAPSVTFKDLASNGLVLNASGFVNSPRSVAGARSDLLFTILDRLRSEGIALSSPQSLLMIQDGGPASAAPAPATPD